MDAPAESSVRTKTPFALMLRRVTEIWPIIDSAAMPPREPRYTQAFTSRSKTTTYCPVATFSEDVTWLLRASDPFVATTAQRAVAGGPVAPEGPAGPATPGVPGVPDAPFRAATVLSARSRFYSDPSITCADATLFLGSVTAA
jgi:hypothetical protein